MSKPRNRVQVTLSPAMRLSLDLLAERSGLPVAAQAMVLLRQALDRTINSAELQNRLRSYTAQRNHAAWLEDQTSDRAVEVEYAKAKQAQGDETPSTAPM